MAELEPELVAKQKESTLPKIKKQATNLKSKKSNPALSEPKKKKSNSSKKKEAIAKFDLNELLTSLLIKSENEDMSSEALDQLPQELQSTASEFAQLLWNYDFEISEKFKIELLSREVLDELLLRTENLSLSLKAYSHQKNTNALKIIKLSSFSSLENLDKFIKLLSKQYLVQKEILPMLADEITSSTAFKKAGFNLQIKTISSLARKKVDPSKAITVLGNVTTEFNEQDESFQLQVIENLRKWDISCVYQFLTHIDSDRIRVALCKHLAENLTPIEIAKYFVWQNPDSNLSKVGVFKRIVTPAIENFMKWNNKLEDLLILWPHLVNPENGFSLSQSKVKFKNLIGKSGYLAESLRDDSVPLLQDQLQVAQDALISLQGHTEDLGKKLNALQVMNEEISQELTDLRKERQENSREALAAHEAIERQIKVDLLRQLIPFFELALSGEGHEEFMKILEHQRIEMVGRVGQKIRWNPQICESLTGVEIAEGIIVKTGFTWFSGKEVVPLRRMLVKPE